MNIKLTEQIKFLESFEKTNPNAEVLKLTPSRITIKVDSESILVVEFE